MKFYMKETEHGTVYIAVTALGIKSRMEISRSNFDSVMCGDQTSRLSFIDWDTSSTIHSYECWIESATPMTQEHKVMLFRYGFYFLDRMVNSIRGASEFYRGRRLLAVFHQMSKRFRNEENPARTVCYKGDYFNIADTWERRRYIDSKNKAKHLDATFKAFLRGDTSTSIEEAFMDCYQHNETVYINVFHKMLEILEAKGLSWDLTFASTCEHVDHEDNIHINVGQRGRDTVCDHCFENDYVYVEDQGEYWNRDNDEVYWHEGAEEYYSYPEDEDIDDSDSDNNGDPSALMDYSTNVTRILAPAHNIVSSTHGDFLMGLEFEMTCGENMLLRDAVTDVRKQLGEDYCVCKSDGSLPSNGLEIVTAPRGLAEHIKRFSAWQVHSDYRAWDAGSCGMHIHIHSHAFTPLTLGKFVMLINDESNLDFIRKIAGRHPLKDRQAQQYCQVEGKEVLDNPSKAIKGKSGDRYYMINTQNLSRSERIRLQLQTYVNGKNYDTIELRIFRASLRKERMLAQIEFTHACVMFCRVASWKKLDKLHFIEWLRTTNNTYPHLSDWYGIRRRAKKQESLTHPSSAPVENSCADTPDNESV
jgi:Putative amidoligase enzyme